MISQLDDEASVVLAYWKVLLARGGVNSLLKISILKGPTEANFALALYLGLQATYPILFSMISSISQQSYVTNIHLDDQPSESDTIKWYTI